MTEGENVTAMVIGAIIVTLVVVWFLWTLSGATWAAP